MCDFQLRWMLFAAGLGLLLSGVAQGQLICYTCETTERDSECALNVTLFNATVCDSDQTYCTTVSKNSISLVPFYSLVRACSDRCIHDGCGIFDEEEEEHMLCRTCCQEDYCNTDSHAPNTRASCSALVILCVILTIQRMWTSAYSDDNFGRFTPDT